MTTRCLGELYRSFTKSQTHALRRCVRKGGEPLAFVRCKGVDLFGNENLGDANPISAFAKPSLRSWLPDMVRQYVGLSAIPIYEFI